MMSYKLKDLIETKVSGEWGSEDVDGSGVNVIRTANFTNLGLIDFSNVVKRKIEDKKVTSKRLTKGDIIIEKSGGSPSQPVGRVVFFNPLNEEIYLTNNFTSCLRPNKKLVDPKYLFYLFYDLYRRNVVLKYQNKTTGIINLKLDNYLEEKVLIVSDIPDQIRIAEILSQAESLIAQRKQSISLLDELLKSTFLEMFGNPVKKSKMWEKESCGDLFEMKLGKMLSAKNYTGTRLRKYLRNVNVKWNLIDLSDVKEMDFNEKEEENYNLLKGDILVCEGGDVGRTAVLKNDLKGYCYQNALHRLRIKDPNKIEANYFSWFMYLGVTNGLIKKETTSVTIQHFTQDKFKKLLVPIPPIKLQIKFAKTVEKVEAFKSQYQQSLTELQNMYGVLSQKAFRGELKGNVELEMINYKSGSDSYREVAEGSVKYKKGK